MTHPIYGCNLKDEVRSRKKIAEGKTRVFFSSPTDWLIVVRMFLYPFFSLMQEHNDMFCTGIGINMHKQAHLFYEKVTKHGNIMAGDYTNWDLKRKAKFMHATCTVVHNVLKIKGYNESALRIVQSILTDMIFPCFEMLGERFMAPGVGPSGSGYTAEINSLYHEFLIMYMYYELAPSDELFYDNVVLRTYGDDLVASVSDNVSSWFNNNTYRTVLDKYGIIYTTPDKAAIMPDFYDKSQMTFLKRSFVYHDDLGRIVARIEKDTLTKMLYFVIPSKAISLERQTIDTAVSFLYEWFFWSDAEIYERSRDLLIAALAEKFLISKGELDTLLPSYKKMWENMSL
jgi:hypothetical protein